MEFILIIFYYFIVYLIFSYVFKIINNEIDFVAEKYSETKINI